MQLRTVLLGDVDRSEGLEGVIGAVIGVKDFLEHRSLLAHRARPGAGLPVGTVPTLRERVRRIGGLGQQVARQIEGVGDQGRDDRAGDHGRDQRRILGLVDDPCDSPNSAEMVPKVSPVDISSVVYIASCCGAPKALVTG